MDSVLAQVPRGCLDSVLTTRKKLEDEPLLKVLATLENMNIK